jgi:hypothetical protein
VADLDASLAAGLLGAQDRDQLGKLLADCLQAGERGQLAGVLLEPGVTFNAVIVPSGLSSQPVAGLYSSVTALRSRIYARCMTVSTWLPGLALPIRANRPGWRLPVVRTAPAAGSRPSATRDVLLRPGVHPFVSWPTAALSGLRPRTLGRHGHRS